MRRILVGLCICVLGAGFLAATASPGVRVLESTVFDAAALKTIPLIDLLRRTTRPDRFRLRDPEMRVEIVPKVAALTPHAQTLFWLVFFEDRFEFPWSAGDQSFYWFFLSDVGDYAARVREAMLAAGMTRDAAAVAEAMALFHPVYPPGEDARKALRQRRDKALFDDVALAKLSKTFADRDALVGEILAYVARTPDAAAWVEGQRAAMTTEERMDTFVDRLWSLPGASKWETIRAWPLPYRHVLLTHICDFGMEDGDLSSFLGDVDEPWAVATAAAYRAIGVPEAARQIEVGMALFPRPYPTTQAERERLERANDGALRKRLDTIRGPLGDSHQDEAMRYAEREGILPR